MNHRAEDNLVRIGFLGHSGCGKDTAGLFLAEHTQLRFQHSLSWYLAPHVEELRWIPREVLRSPARHLHREVMFQVGNEIREKDPLTLIKDAIQENEIIAGFREPSEIEKVREADLLSLIIWIDRDVPVDPTMRRFGDTPWRYADIRIDNTGTLSEFKIRLLRLARGLGLFVK